MQHMPKVGDVVIVAFSQDDEVECRVKAVIGDQVEIQWPQDKDEGGWMASRAMMSRNADGTWNAVVPPRSDDVHPVRPPVRR